VVEVAEVLEGLGRGDELKAAATRARLRTRWLEGAEALVNGDAAEAAEIYDRIGARADAAVTRLRSAELLKSAGRGDEADEELRRALEFFGRVGAERYVREAEALLVVS
jgi:hypothetical protein